MSVWLVRAGSNGENEDSALENGFVVSGWTELSDLSKVKSRDDIKEMILDKYSDYSKHSVANYAGQIYRFVREIKTGDLVVLPLKKQAAIAIGKITGDYKYTKEFGEDIRHIRKVEWTKTDIPRTAFGQDLLYSFGAFMAVCEVKRNNAESRIKGIIKGYEDKVDPEAVEEDTVLDLERIAKDQIANHIKNNFSGHELSFLVSEIFKAQGYVVNVAPPGPDGGIDIFVGNGILGFEEPRICVQVKSGTQTMDVKEIRSFQGAMRNFGAEKGLFVSWGGFNREVQKESKNNFFTIRLWDSDKLVEEVLKNYEKMSDTVKNNLPLKRIWTLIKED